MNKWLVPLILLPAIVAVLATALLGRIIGAQAFLVGLGDPVFDLEQFVSLIAVGLWAGRLGGAALWTLPLSFMAGLSLGFLIAANEPGATVEFRFHLAVIVSAAFLVVAALLCLPLPSWEATGGLMAVGLCHGYLGGAAAGDTALPFGLGFFVAAVTLQALGVQLGLTGPRAS